MAILELVFDRSSVEPLKPLQDEIADQKLGPFIVDSQLYVGYPGLSVFLYVCIRKLSRVIYCKIFCLLL